MNIAVFAVAMSALALALGPGCSPDGSGDAAAPPAESSATTNRPAATASAPADAGGRTSDSVAGELAGTSWRLVNIQSMEDTEYRPENPALYTLEFLPDGSMRVLADCNRGTGSWTSESAGQLLFGDIAATQAQCPPGSLHDRYLSQFKWVRSYVMENGHLFLATMADGSIIEFAPAGGATGDDPYEEWTARSGDAVVPGTGYHATGDISCSMAEGQPAGSCPFGVKREGNGTGMVVVTRPDGRTRAIFFDKGQATGYDMSEADPGEFRASREGDTSIIHIGPERYEIFDAVIWGG